MCEPKAKQIVGTPVNFNEASSELLNGQAIRITSFSWPYVVFCQDGTPQFTNTHTGANATFSAVKTFMRDTWGKVTDPMHMP